ncbi:MAG: DUF167 domain-containing protein [Treponema sp.]|jgi:uncharacterized protein (TIGR00251 family)|nr:DUF167 domain-containing protein [Treponema sp.]
MADIFTLSGDSIHVDIKAIPGASKNEIAGIRDGRLRVRIAAAPEGGRANTELREFLAKLLGCAKSEVVLLRGEKSRLKTLAFPLACRVKLEKIASASEPGPPRI